MVRRAEEYFVKALERDPQHVIALCNYGALLHLTARLAESAAAYEKAIQLDNNCKEAFCNLGALLALRHDVKAADASYRRALELDPSHEVTL